MAGGSQSTISPDTDGDQVPAPTVKDSVQRRRAARAIGGGFKLWGMIIDPLHSGRIPFAVSDDRAGGIEIAAGRSGSASHPRPKLRQSRKNEPLMGQCQSRWCRLGDSNTRPHHYE